MVQFAFAMFLAFFAQSETDMVPADGLVLDDPVVVSAPVRLPTFTIPAPTEPIHGAPTLPDPMDTAMAVATLLTAGTVWRRRRDDEPFYVIVHGNGGSAADFDGLLAAMEVPADRVVAFDYTNAARGPNSTVVSRFVDTSLAASALDALVRQLARSHSNIHTIHHSKGAAAGVEMIAAIDDGVRPRIDGYRGATLLDPPIADGPLGVLQRIGQGISQLPDNGGFDPIRCGADGCRDIRAHLGERAGVEVVAIRNPDAELTNFTDEPDGLRVYDLASDGGTSAWWFAWNPIAFTKRVFTAHRSVLDHPAVADCISSEVAMTGSCDWKGVPRRSPILWGRGNGRHLAR